MSKSIRRGDIFIAELDWNENSILLRGRHPVVILSNWKACNKSPIINVVPITSRNNKCNIPAHVRLGEECGLDKESTALCEQLLPIPRENLLYAIGKCSIEEMRKLERATNCQLGFTNDYNIKMFQTVKSMLDELEEIDRCLNENYSDEICHEREMLLKDLNRYCVNNSIDINLQMFCEGERKDAEVI